jgi:predicted TIM-barrel fold metal-dependent hydrolase
LETALKDPALDGTRFILIHGGWPFAQETPGLLYKPNIYADFSAQAFLTSPGEFSRRLRSWISWIPEKVLFGTDGYPYEPLLSWEESAWMWNEASRTALATALTGMVRDGEITRERARELAHMVLRDNAVRLYHLDASE